MSAHGFSGATGAARQSQGRLPMHERKSQVTVLLKARSAGERGALDALLPLVIDDLRRVAQNLMARETHGHLLDATALVNELYLKLAAKRSVHWESRAQFFAAKAQMMRRILVDHARRRSTATSASPARCPQTIPTPPASTPAASVTASW